MLPIQFLNDQDGQPLFAILPYEDYLCLAERAGALENVPAQPRSLLSADKTRITLPYGGPGAHIDLVRLADYFDRKGSLQVAVNMRAQALDKFPPEQRDTLDPFIRRHFLPEDSPYKNTMQATTEVVDALVESSLFRRIKMRAPEFYRTVNGLEVQVDLLQEYLKQKGRPERPLPL